MQGLHQPMVPATLGCGKDISVSRGGGQTSVLMEPLERLTQRVIECTRCPRLVAHREAVARAR